MKILREGETYSFRSYFEMPYDVDTILAELGYSFQSDRLHLPHANIEIENLVSLQQEIETNLKLTILSSEISRREAIVAPILFAVARFCHCRIRLEYPLNVSNWLRGSLDYLLIAENSFLVVEAKRDDLARGFTQLATELIALAEAEDQKVLYGAVTIGEAWRFGKIDVNQRCITQDISLISIPDRLKDLFQILVGILTHPQETETK